LIGSAKVGILGLAFKENVRSLRTRRVTALNDEQRAYALEAMTSDTTVAQEET